MGNQDFPDIYALALGPVALGLGYIYQANPSYPCYNYYICCDRIWMIVKFATEFSWPFKALRCPQHCLKVLIRWMVLVCN